MCIPEGIESCLHSSLRTDKDTGNFWAWFWLVAFGGAREVLGLVGEEGSEQEGSRHPKVGTLLINTCFLQKIKMR